MRGHGGLITGRGGENVKRMERESGGARMKMDRDKAVVVTGFADQVARAVRLVERAWIAPAGAAEGAERDTRPAPHTPPAWTALPESGEIRRRGRSRARRSE